AECFEEPVVLLSPSAHDKHIELILLIYSDVPEILIGDETRIRQILVNLVNNAIKFTHQGEVIVRVMVDDDKNGHRVLKFSISDTGIGISKKAQATLFETFQQADSSTSRTYGGTGLGLSISKKLAQSMNGDIKLNSTLGMGSTFVVEIPLVEPENILATPVPLPFIGKRAILADKHKLSRLSLQHLLESFGIETIISSFPVNHSPSADLIVLGFEHEDINSGFAEAEINRLREICWIPFLILMSATEKTIADHYQSLSGDWYLSKPVATSALKEVLSDIFSVRKAAFGYTSTHVADHHRQYVEGRRVLVVDDNEINLKLVSTLMRDKGAIVSEAGDGLAAVELTQKIAFDLIIMDIHMPRMKGTTAAMKIRESEKPGHHVPIIALTADAVPSTRAQIKESRMDGYLLKPIEEQQMWNTIESMLSGDATRPPVEHRQIARQAPQAGAPLPDRDIEKALSVTGGDRNLADEMYRQLLHELPVSLSAIEMAFSEQNWRGLWEHTHRLHGSTSSCGVPALDHTVQQLEVACRETISGDCENLIGELRVQIDRLLKT
ncbi:MAG: ATP-binding protein, partial [Candidatus Thiodiazotropha sp.]